jgi:6-phosphogluconolactonase (cycloisomerase 2 family)
MRSQFLAGLVVPLFLISPTAAAQSATLSQTTLAFGNVSTGTSSSALSVILTNPDTGTLLGISSVTASGDYTESDNCNGLVAPSSTCTLLITFRPSAAGAISGVVSINDDANNSPQLITTSGTGFAPVTVSPTTLTYGTISVGKTSATQTLTLTNATSASVTIGFTASGDFQAAGGGTTPCTASLAASASCTINVKFSPTQAGAISGSIAVTQSVNSTPQIVALSGTGSGGSTPPLSFSPTTLAFGSVGNGGSSKKTLMVTNNSASTVNISAFTASGDYTAAAGSPSPCGGALTSGSQCSIAVTFKPTGIGALKSGLTITDNSSVPTQIVNLTGTGVTAVTLSPTSLTFASQNQGVTSPAQTVTVTNNLKAALAISSIQVSGDYSMTTTCGSSLAAAASCNVSVSFSPIARTGSIPGTLTLTSSAKSSPDVVQLSGAAAGVVSRFAYAANDGDNTISMYTVDVHSGQLRPHGYVLAGNGPTVIAVAPSQEYAYCLNGVRKTVSVYSINAANGKLTKVKGTDIGTGDDPLDLKITPTGSFIYVANDDGTVSGYVVNSTNGTLSAVSGSPFPTGNNPDGLAITPSSQFLYVANLGDNAISAYKINATTGALTEITGSPFKAGFFPRAVTVDPTGKFAFAANLGDDTISAYTIDATTGALKEVTGSPYNTSSGPTAVAVDQSGKYLFAPGENDSGVSAFSIAPGTGELTLVPGSPFATLGTTPFAVTVDATNQFLYVADKVQDQIATYSINPASGVLTFLHSVVARMAPLSVAVVNGTTPITYVPKFVYTANLDEEDISAYTINAATGILTAVSGSPFAAGKYPVTLAPDPSGRYLYVVNSDDADSSADLSSYRISASTGALKALADSPLPLFAGADAATVDPSGRFFYVLDEGQNVAEGYTLNSSTGLLHPIHAWLTGAGTALVAVDPAGRFLYELGFDGNGLPVVDTIFIDQSSGVLGDDSTSPVDTNVSGFAGDPSGRFVYVCTQGDGIYVEGIDIPSGTITKVSGTTSPFPALCRITVDPTGRFLYAADDGGGNVVYAYTIDPKTGALTAISGSPFPAGSRPEGLATDPTGRFLYVANGIDNNIYSYSIDPISGALKLLSGSPTATGVGPLQLTTIGLFH